MHILIVLHGRGGRGQANFQCCTFAARAREGGGVQRNRDCAHFVHVAREGGEGSGKLELVSGQRIGFGRGINNEYKI